MLCTELYALVVFVKSPHSLVPRSFGFLTQTTRAYNPVRRTFYDVNYIKQLRRSETVEVGCPRHPGATTIGNQLQDGDRTDGWQNLTTQP